MRRHRLIASSVACLIWSFCFLPAHAGEMLVLSDIHFNPTANKSLIDSLAAAAPEQWERILAGDPSRMSGYGEDTNWRLLVSALKAIKDQAKPDAVLVTGDFLVHDFQHRFNDEKPRSNADFRGFAVKTMRFLALQLRQTFPQTPILPVLGNNDDICGDYMLRPNGPFLADTAAIVAGMIGAGADLELDRSWRALGNYAIANPAAPDQRILVLNTNFLSRNYTNRCGMASDENPAAATLAWLRRALSDAAAARRQVLLAYHIPPGIDIPPTLRRAACPMTPVPMFAEAYGEEFHRLLQAYRDTIVTSFAGHTHMDGFRLLSENGEPFSLVIMNPAISPIFGQNPAFRRVRFERDGEIADHSVYYLANLADAVSGAAPQWQLEMSFDEVWQLPRPDLRAYAALYRRLGTVPAERERWFRAYAVQSIGPAMINPSDYATYRCAAGNDRSADVARCSCEGAGP